VNIDAAQMGVGGDNSWGARPHRHAMLNSKKYSLKFLVEEKGTDLFTK
jgi:beta-galactosidase